MSSYRNAHSNFRFLQYSVLAAALNVSAGCGQEPVEAPDHDKQGDAVLAAASGQVVLDWNGIAFEIAQQVDGFQDPFPHLRALTMMHLAMHDAVNGVSSKYDHYAFTHSDRYADPVVSAAAAAHAVLSAVYPAQSTLLDAKLDEFVPRKKRGFPARDRGLALGKRAAEAILAARAGDGSDASAPYTPGSKPGQYQYVPPFDFIYRPAFRSVTPLALDAVDQFRTAPQPLLESPEYAADYEEVRAYGRASDSERTPDQTDYASWWYELSEIGWNRIARVTWPNQPKRNLWFTARLFALLNVGLMDAYVAGWDSKLHYDFWRPYTAIRAGNADGNASTIEETDWEPLCVTPPIQDYPSTHSALGAAGAAILFRLYGRDVPFVMESTSSKVPGQKRSFTSFQQAATENADSRVACGIHFRFATRAGLELGSQVGAHATESVLLPARRAR